MWRNILEQISKFSEYKFSGVYAIKNTLNNKIYVGSSDSICWRLYDHRKELNSNSHHSIHLQRAWNKYGSDVFVYFLVERVDNVGKLLEREQYWMDEFRCYVKDKGYNISPTAGSCRGIKLSEEHKEKLRQAHIGKVISEETRRKLSAVLKEKCYWRGKHHSQETRAKIAEKKTGIKQSVEVCERKNNSIRQGGSRGVAGYKGVSLDKRRGMWSASMKINRKVIYLGRFDTAEEAAENYDYHIKRLFPGAYINFPEKDYSNFVPKRVI